MHAYGLAATMLHEIHDAGRNRRWTESRSDVLLARAKIAMPRGRLDQIRESLTRFYCETGQSEDDNCSSQG